MTADDPTADMYPDAMANVMTDETLAAMADAMTDEISDVTVAEAPVEESSGDPSGAEPRNDRAGEADVRALMHDAPRRRHHKLGGRRRVSPEARREQAGGSPEIAGAAGAPEPGGGPESERCNSCTDSASEAATAGAPGSPGVGANPAAPRQFSSPRGPVTAYHPGRLAGVLTDGTLVHTHYSGAFDPELRPSRRDSVRPPIPRAEHSPNDPATLTNGWYPLQEALKRGAALLESTKPLIRDLAERYPRRVRPAYDPAYEVISKGNIDEAALAHPLSMQLKGIAQRLDFVVWMTHRTLVRRYGPRVTDNHVLDVAERVVSWQPTGEMAALDVREGEYGCPEPFVAYGDVAHVRQEIVRTLMSVAGTARGVIRGSGETALLAYAAALEAGYEIIMSQNTARWFHAYDYSRLWHVTGVANWLREYGVESFEYGPFLHSQTYHRHQASMLPFMQELHQATFDLAIKPRCYAGNAAATEAFVQLVGYCLRRFDPPPLVFAGGSLVVFRSLADAREGTRLLNSAIHWEARAWPACSVINRVARDVVSSQRDDLWLDTDTPAPEVPPEAGVPMSPARTRVLQRASAWHQLGCYRVRRARDEILVEPSLSARRLFFERLLEHLNRRSGESAGEYVTTWRETLSVWSGSRPFEEAVISALPDMLDMPDASRRSALAGLLDDLFRRHTGRPMVRSARYLEIRDHFRAHGRFPDSVHGHD